MADLDLVGRTIAGKYSIESRVGTGAMGAVFRARHNALEQAVAVKVMHPDIASEKSFAARFKREAMTTVRLAHPNSIRLFDFGEEPDGLLYLVMEYVDGRDLAAVLANEWPLSTARIVSILRQVLGALSAAHDVGIVHRDLKPENILVVEAHDDEQNPTDLVKVCDFGIATMGEARAERANGERRLTTSGLQMGTPEYMSPEQARGEPTDARSDVYSVGVILYEMLTRRVPFEAENALGVALKHVSTEPSRPSSIRDGIDPNLEAICLEALVKDVRRRFQSAREMRAALASVVAALRAGDRAGLADSDSTIGPPAVDPDRATFTDEADTKKTLAPPDSERAGVVSVPRLRPVIIETTDPVESAQRRAVTVPRLRVAPPVPGLDSSPHVVIVPKDAAPTSRRSASEPATASSPPSTGRIYSKRVIAGLLFLGAAAAGFVFVRSSGTTTTAAHAPPSAVPMTGPIPNTVPATTPAIAPTTTTITSGADDDHGGGMNPATARPLVARASSHQSALHPAAIANAPQAPATQVAAAVSTSPLAPSPAIAATIGAGATAAPIAMAPAAAPSPKPVAPQATAIPPASFDASNGRASVSVSSTDAVLKRDVTAAVSRSVGAVTACYQAELRAVAAPHTGSGAVHLDINETGSVRAARASIGFATSSLARCVERAFVGVRISGVDTGSASADLSITFDLK